MLQITSALQENCKMKMKKLNSTEKNKYFQINQPDASVSQIYCLSFKYNSTCFWHSHAHHQELINCSSRLWFTVGTW
jgi:hypothetical protein